MKRLSVNLLIFFFFASALTGSVAQSMEEMRVLVTTMNREMMDLVKAGRYESLGKYYDINAISLPNYRAVEKGYKLILNNNLGRKKGGYQVVDGEKISTDLILGEDMMADIGTYSLTLNFPGLASPRIDLPPRARGPYSMRP